ncbi:hypothetical protein WJX72_002932 [[Myrmecia] bisecta]|uniref:Nudix hydrolase domain-containing protein n=1 Tax=[Myrmecia] bisecta TaxID=41462 RepID=A0AAW1R5T9_9CHLO
MVVTRSHSGTAQAAWPDLQASITNLRRYPRVEHLPVSQKHAAVLVPLFQDADGVVRVILTLRSAKLNTHKGEVCRAGGRAGGKRDPSDGSDEATALREAQEELGLDPAQCEVITELPPFLSKHRLSVTPVVAVVPLHHRLQPNADEVEQIFTMPLHLFLQDVPSHTYKDVEWESMPYRLHYFQHEAFVVWGLTAAILIQVAQKALGRAPEFAENIPGGRPNTQLWFNKSKLTFREDTT